MAIKLDAHAKQAHLVDLTDCPQGVMNVKEQKRTKISHKLASKGNMCLQHVRNTFFKSMHLSHALHMSLLEAGL